MLAVSTSVIEMHYIFTTAYFLRKNKGQVTGVLPEANVANI